MGEEHAPVRVYVPRDKSLPPLRVRIRRPWTAPRDQLKRLIQLLEGFGFRRVGNTFTWELDMSKESVEDPGLSDDRFGYEEDDAP